MLALIDGWALTGGLGWVDSGADGIWLIIWSGATGGETEWGKVDCSNMYPTHPPVGGLGGTCWKCLHLPPNPPPELKNVTKIFYTKCFFYTIL